MEIKLRNTLLPKRKSVLIFIMRSFIFLLCTTVFGFTTGDLLSQNTKIIVDTNKTVTVEEVFDMIDKQTDYSFVYEPYLFKDLPTIRLKKGIIFVNKLLEETLSAGSFNITINKNKTIFVKEKILKESSNLQKSISGIVTDTNGQPLPGANILEKGTTNGVQSDFDGGYTISVSDRDAILIVSYIGFETQEANVLEQTTINISLKTNFSNLDEVVLVGYGSQVRDNVSSAISSIKIDDNITRGITSPDQALQGRLPGVFVSDVSGNTGGPQNINIRGINSINGSNQPLFVINGVPISNTDPSLTTGATFGSANTINPLSLINANDIESITVLKDGASAAIYGSRAANGVILITTKSGKSGSPSFSISHTYGIQSLAGEIEVTSIDDYFEVQNEARLNRFNDLGGVGSLEVLSNERANGQDFVDWVGLMTDDNAEILELTFSASGGSEKSNYFGSIGLFSQEGIVRSNKLRRISGNFNVNHSFTDKVRFGMSLLPTFSVNNRVTTHNGGLNLFVRSLEQRPFDTPFLDDGSYRPTDITGLNGITRRNAVRSINESDSEYRIFRLINNTFLEFDIVDGLTFRPSIGFDFGTFHDRVFWTNLHEFDFGKNGTLTDSRNIATRYILNNSLSYKNTIGKLNYTVDFIHAFERSKIDRSFVEASDFPFQSNSSLATAGNVELFAFGTNQNSANAIGENTIESYIGRINLDFKNKYFMTLGFRRDGASQFSEGNKYGNFPSASFAWNITKEPFLSESDFVTNLKVRVSHGRTGSTDPVSDFASLSLFQGGFNYNGQSGIAQSQIGNDLLTWEKVDQTNVGFDLELLRGRFGIITDFFSSNIKDAILNNPIQATSGETEIAQNIAELQNRGFEVGLNGRVIESDFDWDLAFNFSFVKNKIQSLGNDNADIITGRNIFRVGETIGSYYLIRQTGIYQTDEEVPTALFNTGVRAGDVKYEDVNGDGIINPEDRQLIGNRNPELYGGINSDMSYKGFSLNLFVPFSLNNELFSAWKTGGLDGLGTNIYNGRKEVFDSRWTPSNPNNTTPRAIIGPAAEHNTLGSSRFLDDGSYWKLRATLSYTFQPNFLKAVGLKSVATSFTANNLFVWTNYDGYNPENITSDAVLAPLTKSFLFELKLGF